MRTETITKDLYTYDELSDSATIKITISTDNAAFEDYPKLEVARILHQLADDINHRGLTSVNLRDVNGNTCGAMEFLRYERS